MAQDPPVIVEEVDTPHPGAVSLVSSRPSEVIDISPEKNIPEELDLPPLSVDEDSFALAYIEHGGNVAQAFRDVFGMEVSSPTARGQALLAKPQVVARINELSTAVKDSALVSAGIHLQELAVIRDLAKHQGQLKVALQAERNRGEVAGLYDRLNKAPSGPTYVQVNFASKHDQNI